MGPYLPEAANFIPADFLAANREDTNRLAAARYTLDTAYNDVAAIDARIAADDSLSDTGKAAAREGEVGAVIAKHERAASQGRGYVNDIN